jgi:hypothetical protein
MLRFSYFARDKLRLRRVKHLSISIFRAGQVFLADESVAEVMIDVSRAHPGLTVRRLRVDRWRVSERRITTIQVPVRGTVVALQKLALARSRFTTLSAEYRFVISVLSFEVIWFLIPATALRQRNLLDLLPIGTIAPSGYALEVVADIKRKCKRSRVCAFELSE